MALPSVCENCGTELIADYCPRCGQPRRSPVTSVGEFLRHSLSDTVSVNGRLVRSVRTLFAKPGLLTREYLAGRRVRYTQPFQLYLIGAAVFFLVAAVRPFLWVDVERHEVLGALPGLQVGNEVAAGKLTELSKSGVSLALYAERFDGVVSSFLPALLVGSVILFSLVTYALNRRRERRYIPHLIFALHWSAFYLLIMAFARVLPRAWNLQDVSVPVALVYLTLAQRGVHGQSWLLSFGKAFVLMFVFLLILVLWVQSAVSVGLLLA